MYSYIHIHVYMHIYIYTIRFVFIYTYTCTYTYIYIYIQVHAYIYIYIYIYIDIVSVPCIQNPSFSFGWYFTSLLCVPNHDALAACVNLNEHVENTLSQTYKQAQGKVMLIALRLTWSGKYH